MTKTAFISTLFILLVLSLQPAHAQDFKWQNYVGTTQWRVDVSDDESSCGGGTSTSTHTILIKQSFDSAEIGDYGHGVMKGTFTNNALHVLAHKIPDPPGSSELGSFDIIFSSDCSSFVTQYDWDYSGPEQSCSGTTGLKGTRMDASGCPSTGGMTETASERPDLITQDEKTYKEILSRDPNDFWANWDMAELKKKEGDTKAFFEYFDRAINNEKILQETKERLKEEELKRLHLSEFPTADKSPILRVEENELNNWNGGLIYNDYLDKSQANNQVSWKMKLWAIFVPDSDVVGRVIRQ